jgi:uncharacterized membrane protein YkgB
MEIPFARLALFVIYFWFGILKVFGESPASGLVERLFNQTIPFMSFGTFLVLFGLFECLIGIFFLFRKTQRVALVLLFIHMIMTTGPLFMLAGEIWTGFLVPTLEGQYIIKNLVIISTAIALATKLIPFEEKVRTS